MRRRRARGTSSRSSGTASPSESMIGMARAPARSSRDRSRGPGSTGRHGLRRAGRRGLGGRVRAIEHDRPVAVVDLDRADVAVEVGQQDHALGRDRAAVGAAGRRTPGRRARGRRRRDRGCRRHRRRAAAARARPRRRRGRRPWRSSAAPRSRWPSAATSVEAYGTVSSTVTAVAVVDLDRADVAVLVGQDDHLLDRGRAAVADRIARRDTRAIRTGVVGVGDAVAIDVRRRQRPRERDRDRRQRLGRALHRARRGDLARDLGRRVGLVEHRLGCAPSSTIDRADVAVLVGEHDHALEPRAARAGRRVRERQRSRRASGGPGRRLSAVPTPRPNAKRSSSW